MPYSTVRCQRPERASFISTKQEEKIMAKEKLCQRPERASFISTKRLFATLMMVVCMCQRPERASFISTEEKI